MPKAHKKTIIESPLCSTIFHYTEVGSTNLLAKKLLEKEDQTSFAVVAETQTAGIGYKGDFWESPRGGLWASLAIRPELDLRYLGFVPILSAVGIAQSLQKFDITPILKWPNDLLLQNYKKIGGITVESSVTQFSLNYLIIGFGLNINSEITMYSRPLQDQIATIYSEYSRKIDLQDLLESIIHQLSSCFDVLREEGPQFLLQTWKELPNILGLDNIIVQTREKEYKGRAVDLTKYGHLVLKTIDSELVTLSNGTLILPKIS